MMSSKQPILIVGTVRDVSEFLIATIETLNRAFASFEIYYFLVESDSSDDTRNILDGYSREHSNFQFTSMGDLVSKYPNRIDRLVICRNEYLRFFSNVRLSKYFVGLVVADFDGVNLRLRKESIDDCFAFDGWDVCTSNQKGPYYDLWALRKSGWLDKDCHLEFQNEIQEFGIRRAFFRNFVKPMFYRRESHWIRVDSSFGGLAIYRSSILNTEDYFPVLNEEECEHVTFNRKLLTNGARIFINSELINSRWTRNAKRTVLKYIGILIFGRYYSKARSRFGS